MSNRRFPPPWSIEEGAACFIVRDRDKPALTYVYFENESGPLIERKAAHARRGVPYRGEHRQAFAMRIRKYGHMCACALNAAYDQSTNQETHCGGAPSC